MLYSEEMEKVLKRSKEIKEKLNSDIENSGHLLMALYENSDTICHFLFKEDDIIMDDLIKAYYKSCHINEDLNQLINKSIELSKQYKAKKIYDEYIFYVFLTETSVANIMLKELNIDFDQYIEDTLEIMNVDNNKTLSEEYPFLINLSSGKNNTTYIKYKDYLERMIYILNKKNKHNPLLIGNPGVGKTALVEGLAKTINTPIYQLDIGGTVAKTKYRGELEEKIIKTMNYIESSKSILFIDEIHTIVNSTSSDTALDIANILKPYLTKQNIKIIGATTLDEYYSYIEKDKALSRRFNNIFIDEPNIYETKKIITKLIPEYEDFHKIKYPKNIIENILNYTNIYLPNRTFPDKALDVIDELGSRKGNNLYITLKNIIKDYSGIYTISNKKIRSLKIYYPSLIEYYLPIINLNNKNKNNISIIKTTNSFDINKLIYDLSKVFSFKKEAYLEIDLELFQDYTMLNNLIGSSKGYVGYNEGGILSEHIIKFPLSLVYFKNLDKCHYQIEYYIKNLFNKKYFIDNKNRKIYLTNCIFVYSTNENNLNVGLIPNKSKEKFIYDIEL